MLYEYRRYEAMPGKLAALHRRFAEVTTKIWEKHGIRVVGFWEAEFGTSNELYYMLAWEDLADRDRKWQAFQKEVNSRKEPNAEIFRTLLHVEVPS